MLDTLYKVLPLGKLVGPIYHLDLYLGWSPQDYLPPLRPEVLVCTANSFGRGFLVDLLLSVFTRIGFVAYQPYNVSVKITLYT